jgi:hypothetical protein
MKRLLLLVLALVPTCKCLYSQANDSTRGAMFPIGLTMQAGFGSYVIRDEFISHETYSGTLPMYMFTWTDCTPSCASQVTLEYQAGSRIKNFSVSASITEFTFGMDYLYPIGKLSFLSKDVFAYLGPSPDLFFHYRSQNLANGGTAITRAYSVAMLLSAGATLDLVCPIKENILADISLGTNVLSFGGKFVNPDNSDESFFKLLTFFSGLRVKSDIGLRYAASSNLSVRLGYRFELTRIDAWDYFISGSDMGVLSIYYGF